MSHACMQDGLDKHHEIPLFLLSQHISVYIFPLIVFMLCCWHLTIFEDCFRGQSSEGSLKNRNLLYLAVPERAHLLFEAIEFPTMLRSTDGERTGQSG